jgi:hypothetical protein
VRRKIDERTAKVQEPQKMLEKLLNCLPAYARGTLKEEKGVFFLDTRRALKGRTRGELLFLAALDSFHTLLKTREILWQPVLFSRLS